MTKPPPFWSRVFVVDDTPEERREPTFAEYLTKLGIDVKEVPGWGSPGADPLGDIKRYAEKLRRGITRGSIPASSFHSGGIVARSAHHNHMHIRFHNDLPPVTPLTPTAHLLVDSRGRVYRIDPTTGKPVLYEH